MTLPFLTLLIASCNLSPEVHEGSAPDEAAAPETAAKSARPSLVLVTLDTTRADRIGTYGYADAHTPTVDALAASGARFDRAYAVVPLTTPAHASILTGLYPTRHGIHNNGDAILPDSLTTLAEILQDQGYGTAASVSAFVTTRVWNLDQGFDDYFDDVDSRSPTSGRWSRERAADAVVDDLLGWLEAREDDAPFFLWAHFYDPHDPHVASKIWTDQLPTVYDAEIATVDEQIARLKAAVDREAGPAGTAWIAVADHGEAFDGEHGETSHGLFLFDPTVHIPFVVQPPVPLEVPVTVDAAVSNVDVTPTALGMLGLPIPEDLDGVDLSPFLRGETPERGPVYMESEVALQRFGYHPEIAAAEGQWKLMDTPNSRLFDLAVDPDEASDLSGAKPEEVARLQAAVKATRDRRVENDASAPAPEVYEQLAALGYIGGSYEVGDTLPELDAKDQLETITRLEAARVLLTDPGRIVEAEALYREILAKEPQLSEALGGLARTLTSQGRLEEAEAAYRIAIEYQPTATVPRVNLANCLAAQGRLQEGFELMETVHQQVPGDELSRVGILRMLTDLRRTDDVVAQAESWLAEDPGNLPVRAHLGIALTKTGQHDEAEAHLKASLADGLPRQMVHRSLAHIAATNDQRGVAIGHLRAESGWFPGDMETRKQLALQLMLGERWDEAAAEYRFVVEARPEDLEALLGLVQAVFNTGDYALAKTLLGPALLAWPDDPELWLLQANVLGKLGDREEALRTFERAKALREALLEQMDPG